MKDLINLQRAFFKTGKTRSLEFRVDALKSLLQVLLKNESRIFQALHSDLGKHELEAYSMEYAYVIEEIKQSIKSLKKWASPQKISSPLVVLPARSEIHSVPFGNVLVIAPWNYPFQLALAPVVGAIAAGNTVILKASELAPATDKIIQEIIREAFKPEFVTSVVGGVQETQALLNEKFDFIFFTGSTRVGQIVMEKASKFLTPVCLELGGKSPCIVDKNIDIQVAARRVIWGKFLNAGQTCVAPDYLYVHKDIHESFLKALRAAITEFYGTIPHESKSYGRIINEQHFERLTKMLKNANVYFGGESIQAEKFIAPTIVTDVTWQDAVMKEEIFGPILPVMKFQNVDEAISEINVHGKPLAFYVFSKDKAFQNHVLDSCSFGGACVNDCIVHLANPELPFGGVGDSGMGNYHGKSSFDVFSHKKSILRKPFWADASMRYPPYTEKKLKLLKFFLG